MFLVARLVHPMALILSQMWCCGIYCEDASTSPNLIFGMQTGQKCCSRSRDDMFFINGDEQDLIVEADSDGDML